MAAILLSLWLAVTPYGGCIDGANCETDAHCAGGICDGGTCICEGDDHEGLARR